MMEEQIKQLLGEITALKAEVERLSTALGANKTTISFVEQTATPTAPANGTEVRLYMKADKFVLQYQDGATLRYKYLDLTGTGATWTHTTSAP